MQGVFITGTGTDVGKTFVGTAIARALTQHNITVIPRKPVESGCLKQDNALIPKDATALKIAADYKGDLSEICPYRFEPALSPVRAAHLANKTLTIEQLANICLTGSENGYTLVEGAGGFYSPLAENGLNADLAAALQLPVLLIADDRLGALNQVLLSAEAIQLRGLHLVGVVLNAIEPLQNDDMDNSADLREHLNCPVFHLPFIKQGNVELPVGLIDLLVSSAAGKDSSVSVVG